MASSQEDKQFIQLSGEFGVASELYRRKIQASITYGNSKKADLFVISQDGSKAAKVEVKSSKLDHWIVGGQALRAAPHVVWVFAHLPAASDAISPAQVAELGASHPRYFVLTSDEVKKIYEEKLIEAENAKQSKAAAALVASSTPASTTLTPEQVWEEQGSYAGESLPEPPLSSKSTSKVGPIIFERGDVERGYGAWQKVRLAINR